jgi:hypothetical protein
MEDRKIKVNSENDVSPVSYENLFIFAHLLEDVGCRLFPL